MPKHPGVPSYRLHKASGQAIVRLSGRMIYLGKFNSPESREAYDRACAEWLSRSRQPVPVVNHGGTGSGLTIVELIAQYWPHAQKHYVKNGKPTVEIFPLRIALRILKELYGSTDAASFGPLKLAALREAMIQRDWSRNTINGASKRIIRCFRWGVSRELLPPSVPEALRSLPGLQAGRTEARETDPVGPVSDADFQATLPHLSRTVADLLLIMRWTGMRPNEACQLCPGDINRDGPVWLFTPKSHKTAHKGKSRVVALGPKAQAILAPYLLRGPDEHCFSPAESQQRQRDLRTAKRITPRGHGNSPGTNRKPSPKRTTGTQYNAISLNHALRHACKNAGVVHWHPNQLRHSYLTEVRAAMGLEAAQAAGGHASPDMTETYTERSTEKAAAVALALG